MREKNSRFKAIIKQNDSDFVKETVICYGKFVTVNLQHTTVN